jgi:hypothetical protein
MGRKTIYENGPVFEDPVRVSPQEGTLHLVPVEKLFLPFLLSGFDKIEMLMFVTIRPIG